MYVVVVFRDRVVRYGSRALYQVILLSPLVRTPDAPAALSEDRAERSEGSLMFVTSTLFDLQCLVSETEIWVYLAPLSLPYGLQFTLHFSG